jgi:hypothetical protein
MDPNSTYIIPNSTVYLRWYYEIPGTVEFYVKTEKIVVLFSTRDTSVGPISVNDDSITYIGKGATITIREYSAELKSTEKNNDIIKINFGNVNVLETVKKMMMSGESYKHSFETYIPPSMLTFSFHEKECPNSALYFDFGIYGGVFDSFKRCKYSAEYRSSPFEYYNNYAMRLCIVPGLGQSLILDLYIGVYLTQEEENELFPIAKNTKRTICFNSCGSSVKSAY